MPETPETLAETLDRQYAERRAFDRSLFGDLAPADDSGSATPEDSASPASEVAGQFSEAELALLRDRAESGDATALALLEEAGEDLDAGPASGDLGGKRRGRLKRSTAAQFNETIRRSFGGRR